MFYFLSDGLVSWDNEDAAHLVGKRVRKERVTFLPSPVEGDPIISGYIFYGPIKLSSPVGQSSVPD